MLNQLSGLGNRAFVNFTSNLDGLSKAVDPVQTLTKSIIRPFLLIVVAVGAIYCIFLGVKLAKAEEPQEKEKAKGALKNAIVGFLLIFVLIMVLQQVGPVLIDWVAPAPATK